MEQIHFIIFSFNRALQLDTLLASIEKYWNSPSYKIEVLYNTTNSTFEQGYKLLKEKYSKINFHKEKQSNVIQSFKIFSFRNIKHLVRYPSLLKPKTDFRSRLVKLIKESNSNHIMFLTDDSMFIRNVNIDNSILNWILESPFQRQYCLRLGEGMNKQPNSIKKDDLSLYWNTYNVDQYNNWGYHFSVDAHIYSKELILKLFSDYIFTSPNTLEGYICNIIRTNKWLNEARAPYEAKLLSYPINMVQTFAKNENLGVDCEMMNDWFLNGYTMEYPVPETIDIFQQYPQEIYLFKHNERIIKKIQ